MPELTIKSNLNSSKPTDNDRHALNQIDACVSCGLCLNACPTYGISRTEAESPRGRLSIIQGLLTGAIEPNRMTFKHLDNCLMCGACERLCPANVEYTAVMDQAKSWLKKKSYSSFYDRFFNWLVFKPWRIRWLARLTFLYKYLGMQKLLRITTLKPYQHTKANSLWKNYYPVAEGIKASGDVYLFKGCVSGIFDQDTIDSSIAMLNAAGFNVLFPENQRCCGAIASHSGDVKRHAELQTLNKNIFNRDIPIIVTSTGCFKSVESFRDNTQKTYDVMEFLQQHIPAKIEQSNKNYNPSVLVHIPCSQKKMCNSITASRELIKTISAKLSSINPDIACCGSAGTYMYRNKKLANVITIPVTNEITNTTPDVVLTQNIGCRMQLMNQTGQTTEAVMHPVTWLYKHYEK